jgi:hypothetical protein
MKRMRKCNDEIYQLAKDQALVKNFKNKRCRPFCLCNVCNSRIQKLSFMSLILFPTCLLFFCPSMYRFWLPLWFLQTQKWPYKKDALARESTLCVGHSLYDFVRSKIYIIDHNPSWKENQRHKREFLDPRVTNITSGGHKQKGLNLLFFNSVIVT